MSKDQWGERDCTFAECEDEEWWVTSKADSLKLLSPLSVIAKIRKIFLKRFGKKAKLDW